MIKLSLSRPILPFHYGWLIVVAATLCNFAIMGLARLGFGMLLPSMGTSLSFNYSNMGLISTFNFVGYLVAVLSSGWLMQRLSARYMIFAAVSLASITLILIGTSSSFITILFLYFLTGVGSGAANIPLMTIVTTWFSKEMRGKATGFVVSGTGLAMLLSGKLIPFLNEVGGQEGWRLSWFALGGITLLVALTCLLILRNRPEDLNLRPVGEPVIQKEENLKTPEKSKYSYTKIDVAFMGSLFMVFGFTYVIYATFFVTSLVEEQGYSELVAGNFWSIIGLLSIFSGPILGTISDKWGRSNALVIIFSIQTIAYVLAATLLPGIFLYTSIVLFGIVAWSVPSVITALVADKVGPENTPAVLGQVTVISALGQIAGPVLAGIIAENTQSFAGSFLMAGCATFLGIFIAFRTRKRPLSSSGIALPVKGVLSQ